MSETASMREVHGWVYPVADDFMWREAEYDGSYQRAHFDLAMRYVTDRRCAIDAGAHVGQFTTPMAAVFDHVISVEPAPDTFECLSENIRRFGLTNVEAKQVALGSQIGKVGLELDAVQAARANTGGRYVVAGGNIPVERIDDWTLPALGFLKLDVEGSEPNVLNGAMKTLDRCRPIVLFESKGLCQKFGFFPRASQNLLTLLGYKHIVSCSRDEIWGSVK